MADDKKTPEAETEAKDAKAPEAAAKEAKKPAKAKADEKKPAAKPKAKAEAKETKPKAKAEEKKPAEKAAEAAPEAKAEPAKAEAKSEAKAEPAKAEAKAEAAPETAKPEAAPETAAAEAKPEAKAEAAAPAKEQGEAGKGDAAKAGEGRGGRGGRGGGRGRGGRDRDNRRGRREEEDDGIIEKLVHINRVSKTVKGGKRFGFAAMVVVGDGSGRVGFGHGKAREVPEAISKATAAARKKMIRVPLKEGRTLHHDAKGRFGAGKVTIRTAPPGTGIIAGGPMRAVFESLGVADVVTKSVGSSNPYNMIRATFDALTHQTSPKSVAQRRGKKVADLLGRGGANQAEAEADAAAVVE